LHKVHPSAKQLYHVFENTQNTTNTDLLRSPSISGGLPGSSNEHMKRADTPKLCTTQACTEYANLVVSNISPNYTAIDPCQDFHEYVCGGFKQTHDYRPEQTTVSPRSAMNDASRKIIQEILEGSYIDNSTAIGSNKAARRENFEKLKTAYSSCMDEESIKQAGTTPLRNLLDELDAYYPVIASNLSTISSKEELTNVLVWLSKNSVPVLVSPVSSVL
jgi:endothelin-converting enzyme